MELNRAVAENIKRIRKQQKLSLERTAALSGVSRSMLGQIERGDANPSISMIWKIANGLQVTFSTLITEASPSTGVIDKADVSVLRSDDGLLENIPFFPFNAQRNFEMYEIILQPGGYLDGDEHPPRTQEFIIVFDGALCMENGGESHVIRRDQAYQFLADSSHRYSNVGSEVTRFALVLFYPEASC